MLSVISEILSKASVHGLTVVSMSTTHSPTVRALAMALVIALVDKDADIQYASLSTRAITNAIVDKDADIQYALERDHLAGDIGPYKTLLGIVEATLPQHATLTTQLQQLLDEPIDELTSMLEHEPVREFKQILQLAINHKSRPPHIPLIESLKQISSPGYQALERFVTVKYS